MKQLKRLHLSNLMTTEMGELWGGYNLPEVTVTPRPTLPPLPEPTIPPAVNDNIPTRPPMYSP